MGESECACVCDVCVGGCLHLHWVITLGCESAYEDACEDDHVRLVASHRLHLSQHAYAKMKQCQPYPCSSGICAAGEWLLGSAHREKGAQNPKLSQGKYSKSVEGQGHDPCLVCHSGQLLWSQIISLNGTLRGRYNRALRHAPNASCLRQP